MDQDQAKKELKKTTLFHSLTDEDFNELIKFINFRSYQKNEVIISQGDYGNKLYIVLEGTLEVYVINNNGQRKSISHIHSGEYFGELAILVESVRYASVRSITPCYVAWLHKSSFTDLINAHPSICRPLLNMISYRLAKTLNVLSDTGKRIIVNLNYAPDSKNRVEEFEEYFTSICSFKVIKSDTQKMSDDLSALANQKENYYILVHNDITKNNVQANNVKYSINFDNDQTCDFHLLPNCSRWQIEHVARRIANKTVGIALSSGGALGCAHIGVLNALAKGGIPLDYIVGTSVGAAFGAIFSLGITFNEILEVIVAEAHRSKILIFLSNFSYHFSGLIKHEHIYDILSPIFKDYLIEDLKIPFAAIASDLYTGKTIIIKKGRIVDAVVASNAAPLIVDPIFQEHYLLIDGIATSPLPIEALFKEKIDIKLAVPIPQLNLLGEIGKDPKIHTVYVRSRSMMAHKLSQYNAELADIVIQPQFEEKALMHIWDHVEDYIRAGEEAAMQQLNTIKQMITMKTDEQNGI